MKAIVYEKYGSSEVLELREVDKPIPNDNQLLVKVYATSINPLDWHFMRGLPYIMRSSLGMKKPKNTFLGVDVAGKVVAAGKDVKEFQPGDCVFGTCHGAFAEYAVVSEGDLVKMPGNLTFEQAAALPVAMLTALQGLRDCGQIQPGQKILINGASGGVGTFAVQIAKSFGAEVTGVCSSRNLDMVRAIGADDVIDYTKEDFTQGGKRYDLLFDTVGNRSFSECRRILLPKGTLVMVGGPNKRLLGPIPRMLRGDVLSRFVSQRIVGVMASWSKKDLIVMQELTMSGKVTPVIDRSYRLIDAPDAIRYLEDGHARGKVVIAIEQEARGSKS